MSHKITVLGRDIKFETEYITPHPIPEDRFPYVSSLALDVSGGCNLRCRYCAESITMPARAPMTMEMIHQVVDFLFTWSKKGGVSLHFGSGEPLLHPLAVHEAGRLARERARKEKRPLSLYITTNGTLLNDEIIGWLVEDEWDVKVSLDGGEATHDHNRVNPDGSGTYRIIEKHVQTLAKAIPERFSTTSVLCHGTDPSEVFNSIADLGVRSIEIVPVAAPPGSDIKLNEDDLERYKLFVLDHAQKLAHGEDYPSLISFRKRLQRVLGYGNTRTPCGAGRNFFGIGPDGAIYPCFRFIGIDTFRMGGIEHGISRDEAKRFTVQVGRPYDKRAECRQCWASALCGGPCYAVTELMEMGNASHSQCAMVRAESEAAIWLADVLREENPARLVALMGVKLDE